MESHGLYLCLFRRVNYLSRIRIRTETRSLSSPISNHLPLQNLHAAGRTTTGLLWTILCHNCEP